MRQLTKSSTVSTSYYITTAAVERLLTAEQKRRRSVKKLIIIVNYFYFISKYQRGYLRSFRPAGVPPPGHLNRLAQTPTVKACRCAHWKQQRRAHERSPPVRGDRLAMGVPALPVRDDCVHVVGHSTGDQSAAAG